LALGSNVYNIEGMEVERHETLLRRARRNGGYLHGTDGSQITLTRHEYPYDIGIFNNIAQGMGSSNVRDLSYCRSSCGGHIDVNAATKLALAILRFSLRATCSRPRIHAIPDQWI